MKLRSAVASITIFFCFWGTNYLYANNGGNYSVYSMFIYNFIKYLEWPQNNDKIVIAVWNSESAAQELNKMAKAKSTATREITVANVSDEVGLLNAHMIFVPINSSAAFLKLSEKLKSKPIVVVTEESNLTLKGASMSFKTVSDKIRFQLNNSVMKSAGLKVSGALEALAVE